MAASNNEEPCFFISEVDVEAGALNPKMPLPMVAFAEDGPEKRLLVTFPESVSTLVLASPGATDGVGAACETEVDTEDPNLKIEEAGKEGADVDTDRLAVVALVDVWTAILAPLLVVEVKERLLDGFTVAFNSADTGEDTDWLEVIDLGGTPNGNAVVADDVAPDPREVGSGVADTTPSFKSFLSSVLSNSGNLAVTVGPAATLKKLQAAN